MFKGSSVMAKANAKEYRQAAILFIFMILLFFWPLFTGRILSQADTLYFFPPWNSLKPMGWTAPSNPILNDQTREFLTFFQVARESILQMEFPLWNPYIMAGTPLLANSQSALLFPLNWPFYFLPLFLGFTVSALLKMFIASMGAYALSRRLSLSHLSAILAGTIYTFSVFNIFWLNHPHTNVTLFFPLLLLLAEEIKESPSLSAMAILGLTVGIQLLGGHVEIAFQIAFAVTLFFLFRLIGDGRDRKALLLRLKAFVGGYTLGFFLAGILMIPFLEFLSQSATWQVRSEGNPFFLKPIGFISALLPDFFTQKGGSSDLIGYHAFSLYTGICPLILAMTMVASRPKRISAFFAVLCLFALSIVFGFSPFFPFLTSLPLFKQAPNYYMVIYYVLGMSLLGGMGMDLVLSVNEDETLRRKVKKVLVLVGIALFFLFIGLIFLAMGTPSLFPGLKGLRGPSISLWRDLLRQIGNTGVRSLIFAGLGSIVIAAAFRIRRVKRLLGIFLIGATFADLFIAGTKWNPTVPIHWARAPLPPVAHFLRQDQDIYRIAGIGPVMAPNLATLCRFQDVRGYDVPVEFRYHHFFQKVLKGETHWWIYEFPKLDRESMPFLSLLNVKYVLSLDPLPPPFSLLYDQEVKVYQNPQAFPRAFLVHRIETVQDGPAALERAMALGPELRRVAVLEGPLPQSLSNLIDQEEEEVLEDRVRMVAYTSRRIEMEVETSSPGLLVLGDIYFTGWKAEIDGKEKPILRANYLLRGIEVDSGHHRIRFFYCPLSFYIGFGLTMITGAVILWCLKRKRRSLEKK
jgi:hypothetical protein